MATFLNDVLIPPFNHKDSQSDTALETQIAENITLFVESWSKPLKHPREPRLIREAFSCEARHAEALFSRKLAAGATSWVRCIVARLAQGVDHSLRRVSSSAPREASIVAPIAIAAGC
jgi:hypothetical protein